jgi:tetratricopeptide (TPR) repeat protein
MAEAQKNITEVKSNGSNLLFGLIGLVLGLVVGFMLTTSLNKQQQAGQQTKAGAVKDNEKLPANHPDVANVDIEKEVAAAVEFGKQNQDYDSQLRVGSFLYIEARRFEQAKPYFVKAHELKPEEFEPLAQLGNLTFDYSQESNNPKLMEEAGQWYEKALKIKDDVNVRTDLGITYQMRQPPDYKTAIAEYDKALVTEPKHPPTLYNKARALIGMKDFKGAEEVYALLKAASPQPDLPNALRAEIDKAKGGPSEPAAEAVKIPTH